MPEEKPEVHKVDVVESAHDAAAYNRMQEAQRDTTDDSWGKGVYADQEDQTLPRAVPAPTASQAVPDLRRTRTAPAPSAEPEPEEASSLALIIGAAAGVVAVLLAAALLLGYV